MVEAVVAHLREDKLGVLLELVMAQAVRVHHQVLQELQLPMQAVAVAVRF
jgi:hypothetical protein